ncbi:FAD-dependent monooxygenase [Variovorax sp. efr-133-TYG-130]|uniref:FAD-dependent monooxygenase n=1 Tax=Variovorax sp. efr-133-TYG-130 TaxID=3040327 RepID=UPI002552E26A|nr:FAD-dependent monooxygenase [Variovorax sp. efr-133-TYG-130]
MKIRVIGGGPAGLFYAYLMKRDDPSHDVVVYERDPENATYGWGVVFSDVALSFVKDLAPELYEAITRKQVVFDEMAVVHQGVNVTLAHNTFHRMARINLLKGLHEQCRKVGVEIEFERRFDDVDSFADADLIVAADGANSAIRSRYKEQFQPSLDERPNYMAWYGTTKLFPALSLIFRQNEDGLVISHTYQFSPTHSTFLVEVDPETFRKAGLDKMNEAESLAYCEKAFAQDLDGNALLSNKSNWFRYTIVKNKNWHYKNIVLIGDALRTGHPSVGSGTRLAMQDSIALFDAYKKCGPDVPAMLEEYVKIRQPGSDSLQKAAIKSTEWYEDLSPKLHLDPISFAYDYLTRSGRVDHAEVRKRDPKLAAAYEQLHPELTF